ncbi:MAG TPA: hypothetical protein VEN81_17445, partial [Planctomycetota bacterium]|nr:hypothetical protein [Planctomycetota bacterium]
RPLRINADQPELLARMISEHPRTVVVTPQKWVGQLAPLLGRYTLVHERSRRILSLGAPKEDPEAAVALILTP